MGGIADRIAGRMEAHDEVEPDRRAVGRSRREVEASHEPSLETARLRRRQPGDATDLAEAKPVLEPSPTKLPPELDSLLRRTRPRPVDRAFASAHGLMIRAVAHLGRIRRFTEARGPGIVPAACGRDRQARAVAARASNLPAWRGSSDLRRKPCRRRRAR